jgi:Leucine-rich repeat (LRR) protein
LQLTGVPAALFQLPRLDVLNLSDNKITELPDEGATYAATRIHELILSRNRLVVVPVSLAAAPHLRVLRLDEVSDGCF